MMKPIIEKDGWMLYRRDGQPVRQGDVLISFRGERYIAQDGGRPPHRPGTTGRIEVLREGEGQAEFFPGVFDCEWIKQR